MSIGKVIGYVLRFLFAWIDGVVAKVITQVYSILINLSEIVLYSDNIVKALGRRIGLILGIFMLFRLAISLINYMISPDKTKDGSKGGAKLITNVIVSLVLLATVNVIFETAYKVQIKIVESGIVEKIFFGESGKDSSSRQDMDIGYYLYSGFFTPNPEVFTRNECDDLWNLAKPFKASTCEEKMVNDIQLDGDARDAIILARNKKQMSYVFSKYKLVLAMHSLDGRDEFIFDYIPIVSTAAGIATLLILISWSMEIAARAVKLLFLQIIAPIPIIFNMDLGKGKDVFQKWYKDCFSTYISVFLRLIAINFVVFMIVLLSVNYAYIFDGNWLLKVFLIVGCLIFAKRVPKLIEDMLGIKMDGMSLHPFKKFQEQALFGKEIGSIGKGTVGAAGGAIAGFRAGGRVGNRLGGALAGIGMGYHIGKNEKTPLTSSANGVYKRLVGTDFVNFSFSKSLLGLHAKDRVQEIKDSRNAATEFLNDYNTRLRTSEALTSELTSSLSSKGIDVSNIDEARQTIRDRLRKSSEYLSSGQEQYNSSKTQLEQKTSELRSAQSELQRISEEIKRQEEAYSKKPNHNASDFEALSIKRLKDQQASISSTINAINSETESLSSFVSEYERASQEVESLRTAQADLDRYTETLDEQNELRSRIAIVQKDIDDLSNEKSQRERFYGYDPSPAPDIRELQSDTSGKESYKRRVDAKYNKSKGIQEDNNN